MSVPHDNNISSFVCQEIFGTDNIEELKEIANKAQKYDALLEGRRPKNVRQAGRKKKVMDTDIEQIKELYKNGASVTEIAKRFQTSRPTIYKYIEADRNYKKSSVKMHMDYMYEDKICTTIEVDFLDRKIHVQNLTDRLILTAFGVKKNPDWEDFEWFLEERCLPKTRFQIRNILKDMKLEGYDPLQIVEKTEGRMAEDHHWIRIKYKEDMDDGAD